MESEIPGDYFPAEKREIPEAAAYSVGFHAARRTWEPGPLKRDLIDDLITYHSLFGSGSLDVRNAQPCS